MLETPPRMIVWVVLAGAAAVALEAARRAEPDGWRGLLLMFAGLLAFAAAVAVIDWLWFRAMVRLRNYVEAKSVTEQVRLVQAIGAAKRAPGAICLSPVRRWCKCWRVTPRRSICSKSALA